MIMIRIRLLIILAWVSSSPLLAQLYSPEIKVQQTPGNRIEVGNDTNKSDLFIQGNVYAGNAHSYWGGFKAVTPEGESRWGFQQNERFFVGLGRNVYQRGFSAHAMGIFNGSTTPEDIYLYNENGPNSHFLVLKANGRVGINNIKPQASLDVSYDQNDGATAIFRAESYPSYFNHSEDQHTYIRGGKQGSRVIIGDNPDSKVSIGGIYDPVEKLHVGGKVMADGYRAKNGQHWPDYVFEERYPLIELPAIEVYIKEHKHLPDMPSAQEVASKGIELVDMNRRLLQKIEELTLYLIEEHRENAEQDRKLARLQGEIEILHKKYTGTPAIK